MTATNSEDFVSGVSRRPVASRPVSDSVVRAAGVWSGPIPYVASAPPHVWLLGATGGAGVTTLERILGYAADSGRRWPGADIGQSTNVVIVARETAGGLRAAQRLLEQHAAGDTGAAVLIGLITVAHRPDPVPEGIAQLRAEVAQAAPATWRVDWHGRWPQVDTINLPVWGSEGREVAGLIGDLPDDVVALAEDLADRVGAVTAQDPDSADPDPDPAPADSNSAVTESPDADSGDGDAAAGAVPNAAPVGGAVAVGAAAAGVAVHDGAVRDGAMQDGTDDQDASGDGVAGGEVAGGEDPAGEAVVEDAESDVPIYDPVVETDGHGRQDGAAVAPEQALLERETSPAGRSSAGSAPAAASPTDRALPRVIDGSEEPAPSKPKRSGTVVAAIVAVLLGALLGAAIGMWAAGVFDRSSDGESSAAAAPSLVVVADSPVPAGAALIGTASADVTPTDG